MSDVVISMYDLTGKFVQPWAEAGYECYCIDLQHPRGETRKGNVTFIGGDMRQWRPARKLIDRIAFAASFSPCDDAAVSGARWFRDKGLGALALSIELFSIGAEWIEWLGCPGLAEHPVSTISSYYREADYLFHPWWFTGYCPDDNYTKFTNIWGFNGFRMPSKHVASPLIEEAIAWVKENKPRGVSAQQFIRMLGIPDWVKEWHPDDRIHKATPGDNRANERSATPMGFTRAAFIANAMAGGPGCGGVKRIVADEKTPAPRGNRGFQ